MGIRSDVGLCVKAKHVEELCPLEVFKGVDVKIEHKQGVLWVWEDIKWYMNSSKEIRALYVYLCRLSNKDYLLVTSCSEDPDDTEYDIGQWKNNPWCLEKHVTVALRYEE